jgi:hypothetical protein
MNGTGECRAARVNDDLTRVLRCKATGRYYTGAGWTDDPTHAKCYESSADAARSAVASHLANVEVVIQGQEGTADLICIPIR